MNHYKVVCKECETTMSQCRCPSESKSIRYDTCPNCTPAPSKLLLEKEYSVNPNDTDKTPQSWESESDVWHAINNHFGNEWGEVEFYSGKIKVTVEIVEDKGNPQQPQIEKGIFDE